MKQKLKFNQRNFFVFTGGAGNTLKIGAGGGQQFRFKGAIDEVRIYSRALDADEIATLACADSLEKIAAIPAADRTRAQALKLHGAFLEQAAPNELKQARDRLIELKRQRQSFEDDLPTLMVMEELPQPRPAFLLKRGAYDAPGEKVDARRPGRVAANACRNGYAEQPAGFCAMAGRRGTSADSSRHGQSLLANAVRRGAGQNGRGFRRAGRIAFASGIARLAGRRLQRWQSTGRRTSNGWDVKALLKTIVMSATYRQSSKLIAAIATARSRQPVAGARAAFQTAGGNDPRPGAVRLRIAGREDSAGLRSNLISPTVCIKTWPFRD